MSKETSMEHSAEWCRGAVAALTELTECGSWNGDADSMDSAVKCSMSDYRRLLAEAEAREAGEPNLADQLAAAQAEVERLSTRVDALEDSMNPQDVQAVDAGLASRDALRAQLAEANERAEKAEALADHQATGVDRLSALNNALAARVAELEGALVELRDAMAWKDEAIWITEDGGSFAIGMLNPGADEDEYRPALLHVALARTPAQSLAKVQAAALREAAKEMQEVTDSIVWCEAELQGRQAIIDRVSEMASRLEAEAANG